MNQRLCARQQKKAVFNDKGQFAWCIHMLITEPLLLIDFSSHFRMLFYICLGVWGGGDKTKRKRHCSKKENHGDPMQQRRPRPAAEPAAENRVGAPSTIEASGVAFKL